jgi:acyl transferase domain-containing protein
MLLEDTLHQLRKARAQLDDAERAHREPIAIVGAGGRFPGEAQDLETLWRLLSEGVDAVTPHVVRGDGRRRPAAEGDDDGCYAGSLSAVDGFDAEFFRISPSEADRMDPQQRLVLEVAWEAIEDAGLPVERLRARRTGVFLGLYGSDYLAMQLADPESINAYSGPGCAHSIVANRLSYLLDLHGPSLVVDTACSSSLVAVHLACRALRHGDCDFALAGGVNLILSPLSTKMTEKVLPLAPSGRCRTFDAAADGIVRGEGCGIVVLERTRDAKSTGRFAHALIRGSAVNQDGRTNGLTAPSPRAQRDVLECALADAAVDPARVVYVEAHGTGTPLGDPIEMDALCEVYGAGSLPCGLGSIKTNLGHLEAAAGIAGLLKAALVLEHGVMPPHLHLEHLNPEIDLDGTRLLVPSHPTQLPPSTHPPLAAVSAFGFGGTNAHAVLEAAPRQADRPGVTSALELVLPVSARSPEALVELANMYADRLASCDAAQAAELCAAAALHRTHHPHRYAVAAADPGKLVRRLRSTRRRALRGSRDRPAGEGRPLAFVFCGQGSQWPQMGRDVLAAQPVVRREVEACDAEVRALAGWSLLDELRAPDPVSRLHETELAQPAIAALQLGLAELWRSWGLEPSAVVGHSMGEIVAACVAGALDRATALKVLLRRAHIAERRARGGAMASVGLAEGGVLPLIDAVEGRIGIAALNGPASTVVAGDAFAVGRLLALADSQGVWTRVLPVEYAFHSPLMDGCDEELAAAISDVRAHETGMAIYSTVTGTRIAPSALDAEHWGRNLREPVRLHEAITALVEGGPMDCIEIGPHPALREDLHATLAERGSECTVVGSLRRRRPATSALHASLVELYNSGQQVRWEGVVAELPTRRVVLPLYPWQRRRHWLAGGADPHTPGRPHTRVPVERGDRRAQVKAVNGGLGWMSVARRREILTHYVREHVAEALGLESVEEVASDAPLELFGLDSLTVVELRNEMERQFSITLPLQQLLEGGTAEAVARLVADALDGDGCPASDEATRELDGMSDDDVDAALAALLEESGSDG